MSIEVDEKELGRLKEQIGDLITKVDDERDSLKKGHTELDGRVGKIHEELTGLKDATVESREEFQKQVDVVGRLEKDLEAAIEKMEQTVGQLGGPKPEKSYAELAVECEALKSYRGGPLTLCEYEGPAFQKDVTSATASAGELIQPFRRPGVLMNAERPLSIRDLLNSISISTNAIEWVRENVFTNNAAVQQNEGDVKAKSDITFSLETAPVVTIAHWIAMSRQALADIPMLRGIIESKMRYGLMLKEEDDILMGDGTGGTLNGLMPQATAYGGPALAADVTNIDALRHAVLQASLALYPVDSFVFDPNGWCKVELTKDANNQYMFARPQDQSAPRIWGKRVVESHAMPANEYLAGGFAMGATLWDREQVTVRIAEQHESFFVKNMVALLVEERVGLTVERPTAFVKGTIG